jgi:hypothetical protein
MHDQYQAVTEHFVAAAQTSQQRLQVYFALLAATIGGALALFEKRVWTEVALSVSVTLLIIGVYAFWTINGLAWQRWGLAGKLDLLAKRWTCQRDPDTCFLLLGKAFWDSESIGKEDPSFFSATRRVRYVFSWRVYQSFAWETPDLALIAAINSSVIGLLAFSFLPIMPYGLVLSLLLTMLVWVTHALRSRIGTTWVQWYLKQEHSRMKSALGPGGQPKLT